MKEDFKELRIINGNIEFEEWYQKLMASLEDIKMSIHGATDLDKPIYTLDSACDLFDIDKSTMAKWKKEGLISYSQIGRKVYFSRQDIISFLDNCKISNGQINTGFKKKFK